MTIREALAEGSTALAAAGITNSGLDASVLLAEVLHASRSSLVANATQPLTETQHAAFRGLIGRRLAGECTAYILGHKEFYGLEFLVNPSVLVPRPDTETLVETALGIMGSGEWETENQPLRVLDLCTGSGAIAIALKQIMPELEVWATDISSEALETAKTNAARLLSADGGSVRFFQGDLFEALRPTPHALFPIIISNPPYIPAAEIAGLSPEVRMEPKLALDGGSDGLDIIRRIISRAPEFLCPGGVLLLEADPRQMGQICSLCIPAGFTDIQTYRDLSDTERVIGGILETRPC